MSQPSVPLPDDGQLLFHYKTGPADRVNRYDDIADEYAVVACPVAASGLIVYALYRGVWEANPFSTRPLIMALLAARTEHDIHECRRRVRECSRDGWG